MVELNSLKSKRVSGGIKSLSGSVRAPLVVPLADTGGRLEETRPSWTERGHRDYGVGYTKGGGGLSVRASQASLVHPAHRG
jgi:hypothetical protein